MKIKLEDWAIVIFILFFGLGLSNLSGVPSLSLLSNGTNSTPTPTRAATSSTPTPTNNPAGSPTPTGGSQMPSATPALPAGTLSNSKLGILWIGDNETGRQIIDSGPRLVAVLDPSPGMLQKLREYKQRFPGGITILRIYVSDAVKCSSDQSGAACADFLWSNHFKPRLDAYSSEDVSIFDYLESPCEWDNFPTHPYDAGELGWFNDFLGRYTDLITSQGRGLKPLMGEVPVGNIEPENFSILSGALDKIRAAGGAFSYHAYTLRNPFDINNPADVSDTQYTSMRFRRFYDQYQINMILTEAGYDTPAWGARSSGTPYDQYLSWFDNEIKNNPYVIGATIFQTGSQDNNFSDFEITPIRDWLKNYLRNN